MTVHNGAELDHLKQSPIVLPNFQAALMPPSSFSSILLPSSKTLLVFNFPKLYKNFETDSTFKLCLIVSQLTAIKTRVWVHLRSTLGPELLSKRPSFVGFVIELFRELARDSLKLQLYTYNIQRIPRRKIYELPLCSWMENSIFQRNVFFDSNNSVLWLYQSSLLWFEMNSPIIQLVRYIYSNLFVHCSDFSFTNRIRNNINGAPIDKLSVAAMYHEYP